MCHVVVIGQITSLMSIEDAQSLVMIMLLYHTWLARNDTKDGKSIEDARSLVERVWRLLDEWAEAHASPASTQGGRPPEPWCPPDQGWLKVNTDGATAKTDRSGGGGAVVRDHHGVFLGGASHFFSPVTDPDHAELLACRHGVQLAVDDLGDG